MLVVSWLWIWVSRHTNTYACFLAVGSIVTLFLGLFLKCLKLFPINEEEMLVLQHNLPFHWMTWSTPVLSLQICCFCASYVWMVTGSAAVHVVGICWCVFLLNRVCFVGVVSGTLVGLLVGWLANRFVTGPTWEARPDDNGPR